MEKVSTLIVSLLQEWWTGNEARPSHVTCRLVEPANNDENEGGIFCFQRFTTSSLEVPTSWLEMQTRYRDGMIAFQARRSVVAIRKCENGGATHIERHPKRGWTAFTSTLGVSGRAERTNTPATKLKKNQPERIKIL